MAETLPTRNNVPISETWDITDLFHSDDEFYKTLNYTLEDAKTFNKNYIQRLDQLEVIEDALDIYYNLLVQLDRMANYAELRLSVDNANEDAQTLSSKFSTLYGKIASELSFVVSEIVALSEDILEALIKKSKYPHFLTKLKDKKAYQLSPEVEKAFASLSPTF